MKSLKGKRVLITGGGRGLGRATAILLASEGADIAITGRKEEQLSQTVKEIQQEGVNATYCLFDVSNENEVNKSLSLLQKNFGYFDILINNAGIASFGDIIEMDSATWKQIIDVNLMGAYYVSKNIIPSMIEKKSGDIINVSSTAGLKGSASTSAYSASKAALISLSESMRAELRKFNIRVTSLMPSTIATDMALNLKITDGNPEKVIQAEDFAELIKDILVMKRRAMIVNASLWSTNP